MNSCFSEFFELLRDDSEQICFHVSLIPCGVLILFKMACRFEAFRFDSVCASDGGFREPVPRDCARRQTWTKPRTHDHPTRMIESPTC